MGRSYVIRILLPSGEPDGLRTIEKSNWNGSGIMFPRALISEARQRKELNRAGVYVLIAPPEESLLPCVYVGEGDPIKPRLEQHTANKDFWSTCIAFSSKDESLNKAHVQYIESRLVELAKKNKRCDLDNGNIPARPSLTEADEAEAEGFLTEMQLCFPVLGLYVFAENTHRTEKNSPMDDCDNSSVAKKKNLFYLQSKKIKAQGEITSDGFMVYKDSVAVKEEMDSCKWYQKRLRSDLIANGVLVDGGSVYIFSQDYVFQSPSTASGVIKGMSSNGRVEWKTKEGMSLKQLQEKEAKE